MKINRFLYALLLIGTISLPVSSKNIADYFFDMPAYLLPSLESSYRLELTENKLTRDIDTIQNRFGTTVRLLSLDTIQNHIRLQTTPNARFEMSLFEYKNDTLIGIINTVCGPVCSSYIHFYDREWNVQSINLPEITVNEWLISRDEIVDGVKITDMVQTSFIEYTFNSNNNCIEARNNSLDFLDLQDKNMLQPYFDERVIELCFDEKSSSFVATKP